MNLFQLFSRKKPGEHRIKYIVKGDVNDFNVTYKCGHECQVIQEPHIRRGWKHKFVGKKGDYIYLSAQSNQPKSAVNVLVYEDGRLLHQVSKTGDFPLVLASGTI